MARSWSGLSSARTWDRGIRGAHGAGDAGNTVGAEGPRIYRQCGRSGCWRQPGGAVHNARSKIRRALLRVPRHRASEKEASCCAFGVEDAKSRRGLISFRTVPRYACAGGCASPPPQQLHSLERAHTATVLPRAHPLQVFRMPSEAGGACQGAQELTAVGPASEPPRAHLGHEGALGRVPQHPDAAEPAALAAVGDCTPGGRSVPSHAAGGARGRPAQGAFGGGQRKARSTGYSRGVHPRLGAACSCPQCRVHWEPQTGLPRRRVRRAPLQRRPRKATGRRPCRSLDPGSGSAAACGAPGSAATGPDPGAALAAVGSAPGSVAIAAAHAPRMAGRQHTAGAGDAGRLLSRQG